MQISDYLDAAKKRLSVESDYELAKRLGVGRAALCGIRKGNRAVPLDVAFKIAITLELDPAVVVADLEAQREKNEERRAFWSGFLSRAAAVAALVCTLALSYSGISAKEAATLGGEVMTASAVFFLRRKYA